MTKKFIEFLVKFFLFLLQYNCLFLCRNMYYLPNLYFAKFIVKMKIPVRIRSENSSMAKVRSRQRIEVMTRSHIIMNEKMLGQKRSLLR